MSTTKTPVEPTPLVSDEHMITPMSALIDPQECEGMNKSRIWAVYESERATRETALTKLIAERDELVVFVKRAQMLIKQSKSDTEDLIEELGPEEVNNLWMDELRQLDQNADILLSKYK